MSAHPIAAPLVEATGLSRSVPGGGWALRDASCLVHRGEFVAIMGVSGSGKTTLLSLLGLLDRPTEGTYRFDGTAVSGLTEAGRNRLRGERIGFVFQNSYLVAEETVAENVSLPLRVRGTSARTRQELVLQALVRVGLDGVQGRRSGGLSGGEKQRVAVARAIVGAPDLVLADEPTGALDSASGASLVGLLRQISSRGTAVVVVTHDPTVAAAADRTIEIADGVTSEVRSPRASLGGPEAGDGRVFMKGTPAVLEDVATPAVRLMGDRPRRLPTVPRPEPALRRPMGSPAARWTQELVSGAFAPLSRPLRTGLVLLAYLLGVAAMVGAIGLAQSATGHVVQRLTDASSNQVEVTATNPDDPFMCDPTLPDGATARASRLPGVTLAVPVRTYGAASNPLSRLPGGGPGSFGGSIVVTDSSYLQSFGYRAAQGSAAPLTNDWGGPVGVLGAQAARDLAIPQPGPGVQLWVAHHAIDIVGILAPSGDIEVDGTVFVSRAVQGWLTNWASSYLLVRAAPGYAEPLARALPLALAPENPGSITVSVTSQLAVLQAGISSDLTGLLGVLAWVILALSALSAGTTMFLSVQHRAPEIALRRATGATRASVWRIFTYEGLLVGLAGGILGAAAGTGLVLITARVYSWPCCLGTTVVLLGLAAGAATGVVASAVPALYAARRDPAQILRTV